MGEAELSYYFLNGFLLFTRGMQHQSYLLMSSIGSFFIKKSQKTVIEELATQAKDIYKLLGHEEIDLPRVTPTSDPMEEMFQQTRKLGMNFPIVQKDRP